MQEPMTFDPSLFLASRLEEKAVHAYNYVDLKNKEYHKKHSRQRYLGDVSGRYRRQQPPSTSNLVGSLVSLDFPETRADHLKTSSAIINDQSSQIRHTFKKTQRASQLEEWAKQPTVLRERSPSPFSPERPKTAIEERLTGQGKNLPPRPYTTGGFRTPSRKPPQPSGFMWVKMKKDGAMVKDISFRKITDEIHDYWEKEDKKDRERKRRAKSENIKRHQSFPGQWLSFSGGAFDEGDNDGGSGGMIEAFAGQGARPEDFYNIDGRVGSAVVGQLSTGSKIHIGINGNLQSDSLRVKSWSNANEKGETVEEQLREYHMSDFSWDKSKNRPASLIPLNWEEQVSSPNAKVLSPREPVVPPPKEDLSERHPVIYTKLIKNDSKPKVHIKLDKFCVRHKSKPKKNIDGTESLNQRITMITVDQASKDNDDIDAMTMDDYQTLLHQKLGLSPENDALTEETDHPDLMQKLSGEKRETSKSHLFASFSRDSVSSGVTVDKPPSPCTTGRDRGPTPDHDKLDIQSNISDTSVQRNKSKTVIPLQRHSSPVPTSSKSVSRPRSELTRRSETSRNSSGSRRARSSTSHRKYLFDEPVTPRTVQTPRSALAKPGHLNRARVSSISTGPPEGEQEYIKISRQIPSPQRRQASTSAHTKVTIDDTVDDLAKLSRPESPTNSKGSRVSISSLNVLRGDQEHLNIHEHGEHCGCTTEAKRALSAALSSLSHPATEHTQIINIPTARLSLAGDSDARTLSEFEHPHSGSRLSFQPSLPEEDDEDDFSERDLAELDDDLEELSDEEDGASLTEKEAAETMIINPEDGLTAEKNVTNSHQSGQRSAGKRSVTFQEDLVHLTAPTTTPESTPRGSVGMPSDAEEDIQARDNISGPDKVVTGGDANGDASDGEQMGLQELRAKIKSDLRQTQEEVQGDLDHLREIQKNRSTGYE